MRLEYRPGQTFAHKLDIRSKLATFVAVVVVAFLFTNPLPNLLLAMAVIGLLLNLGIGWRGLGQLLGSLGLVVTLVFLFAALSPPNYLEPGAVLFHAWPGESLPVTTVGLTYAANLGLRIVVMVAASAVLVVTTPLEHFTTLMQRWHVPAPLIFIVVTGLRFVPTMQRRAEQILNAQRVRGAKLDAGGMFGKIRSYLSIMIPLFTSGIRMSEDLSAAMVSRGYGINRRPTPLYDLKPSWRDAVMLVALTCVMGITVWWRLVGR